MAQKNPIRILKEVDFGHVTAVYLQQGKDGRVGLSLLPSARRKDRVAPRTEIRGVEVDSYAKSVNAVFQGTKVESLAQVHVQGEPSSPAFSQGRSMRGSATVDRLVFAGLSVKKNKAGIEAKATFRHRDLGFTLECRLSGGRGSRHLTATTTVTHRGKKPVTLEMLASFCLSGITPFASDDAPGRLVLHRFRSVWSMEGRLVSQPLEDLQLERSWVGWGVRSERFGAVGSMPVSGYFPSAMVTDTGAGVTWAVQLAHNASWQIEAYRRDDRLSLSGGLADREMGHWWKTLKPGESFTTPTAILTSVTGGVDEASEALLGFQKEQMPAHGSEEDLPVVYNEWGTTWGKPSHESMVALADRLEGRGVKYLVMDAGWFARADGSWGDCHGDWVPSHKLYPQGLAATAKAIRARGLVPGLWFEMETCGPKSDLFHRTELLVKRDGVPLQSGGRRFLDLRKKSVIDYLAKRVIGTLRDGGFGYLKVDYNDTMGIGGDGAESPGETLRQCLAGTADFFSQIRRELPDLVIENCSSGGHRLEPLMMSLSHMGSFSDAHECPEIPIIAANLHRLILPRQSQIWACLRAGETRRRTIYSLAAGFLGRLCVSGDVDLSDDQWDAVQSASALYGLAAPAIAEGTTFRHGPEVKAYRHADGWQAVLRVADERDLAVAVLHTFGGKATPQVTLPLPKGKWRVLGIMGDERQKWSLSPTALHWKPAGNWAGCAVVLGK